MRRALALEAHARERRARAPRAAGILEEIYEARGDWEKLIRALEILAGAERRRRAARVACSARSRAPRRSNLERPRRAPSTPQARALKDDPSNADTRAELEAARRERAGAWDQLDVIFSEIAEGHQRRAARARATGCASPASTSGSARSTRPRRATCKRALDRPGRSARRSPRWTRSTAAPSGGSDLIGVFRRRIELADDGDRARDALRPDGRGLRGAASGKPEDAIAAYREVLALDDTSHVALDRPRRPLHPPVDVGRARREPRGAARASPTTTSEQIRLMLRLAALRESKMNMVEPRDRDLPPGPRARARATPRRSPRSSGSARCPSTSSPSPRSSSRSTAQSGDFAKLIGVHEVQVRRSDDPARKVELLHQIAALYEDAGGDLELGVRHLRARARRGSGRDRHAGGPRSPRARHRAASPTWRASSRRSPAQQADTELASQLFTMSARVYESDIGDLDSADRATTARCSRSTPRTCAAAESLDRIFQAPSATRSCRRSSSRRPTSSTTSDEKKAALFQAASIEEDVLEQHDAAIAVYGKVLELDAEDLRAIDALIKLYLALSRWNDLLARLRARRPTSSATPRRRSSSTTRSARSTSASSATSRARSTPTSACSSSIRTISRRSAASTCSTRPRRTGPSSSACSSTRPSSPGSGRGDQLPVPDRRALREAPRRHRRARSSSTAICSSMMPDHAPTLEALEGIKSGAKDPLGAALVLEPIYDATGEWNKLISVLEVQVKAADEPYAKVELLHRIARLQEEMLQATTRAAFETYARAVQFDIANEESLAQPRAARRCS